MKQGTEKGKRNKTRKRSINEPIEKIGKKGNQFNETQFNETQGAGTGEEK